MLRVGQLVTEEGGEGDGERGGRGQGREGGRRINKDALRKHVLLPKIQLKITSCIF